MCVVCISLSLSHIYFSFQIKQKYQKSSLDETELQLAEKEAHLSCLAIASTAVSDGN